MSQHLKGVTVTRIESPGIFESYIIGHKQYYNLLFWLGVQPNTNISCDTSPVILLSSEDEDEGNKFENNSVEPTVIKVESNEIINKHIEKISCMYYLIVVI